MIPLWYFKIQSCQFNLSSLCGDMIPPPTRGEGHFLCLSEKNQKTCMLKDFWCIPEYFIEMPVGIYQTPQQDKYQSPK